MRRRLLKVLIVVFLMMISAASVLFYQGYVYSRRKTDILPIKEAVEAYTKKEDYLEDYFHYWDCFDLFVVLMSY